jgi:hypothetical protein
MMRGNGCNMIGWGRLGGAVAVVLRIVAAPGSG